MISGEDVHVNKIIKKANQISKQNERYQNSCEWVNMIESV